MSIENLSLVNVYQARKRITPYIRRTPLVESQELKAITGANVHLKLENLQVTGSFKIRGASNKISNLSDEEKARGVITVSSGNHGQAVSFIANLMGAKSTICVAKTVPDNKRQAIKALGAELIIVGENADEAMEYADKLQVERGMTMVHPFDDLEIIVGQGTIGLELIEDFPEIDTVIVPLSGGGLMSGIAFTVKSILPSIQVVGVSMERGPAMVESLKAGRVVDIVEEPTLADALAGGLNKDNKYTFPMVKQYVDETVLVSEKEIAEALWFCLNKQHIVVEGGAAVGVAALLSKKVSGLGKNIAIVLSGANIPMSVLKKNHQRGRAGQMKCPITVLNESEIRNCVSLNMAALEEIAKGFTALANDEVTLPPILRIDVPDNNGEVDIKTAYIHGLDSFAIKIASGFLDNRILGLPTGSGMMVLVSTKTGNPIAILLDNGYLTDVRTGLAGAIAAKHLAPKEVVVAGVIGSGMQSRFQVRALKLVRDYSKLLIYGIVEEEVNAFADEISKDLGIEAVIAKDAETVVRESSVVVTTTPSREPYLRAEWLHPGLHITSMGSDSEDKQELYADVFTKADRIVCDKKSQSFRLGELHHALEARLISEENVTELGELTSGKKIGRSFDHEITVCDLTGVGIQDTQIARLAYHNALDLGLGLPIG